MRKPALIDASALMFIRTMPELDRVLHFVISLRRLVIVSPLLFSVASGFRECQTMSFV